MAAWPRPCSGLARSLPQPQSLKKEEERDREWHSVCLACPDLETLRETAARRTIPSSQLDLHTPPPPLSPHVPSLQVRRPHCAHFHFPSSPCSLLLYHHDLHRVLHGQKERSQQYRDSHEGFEGHVEVKAVSSWVTIRQTEKVHESFSWAVSKWASYQIFELKSKCSWNDMPYPLAICWHFKLWLWLFKHCQQERIVTNLTIRIELLTANLWEFAESSTERFITFGWENLSGMTHIFVASVFFVNFNKDFLNTYFPWKYLLPMEKSWQTIPYCACYELWYPSENSNTCSKCHREWLRKNIPIGKGRLRPSLPGRFQLGEYTYWVGIFFGTEIFEKTIPTGLGDSWGIYPPKNGTGEFTYA